MRALVRIERTAVVAAACGALMIALAAAGCRGSGASAEGEGGGSSGGWLSKTVKVPAGTTIEVRLASTISSETAKRGGGWRGVTTAPVIVGDRVVLESGSEVHGIVSAARPAERGSRAMIDLSIEAIESDGKTYDVPAGMEPVVAGSTRARNLGAIAGGAAAGALIGKAVGGDGKDAAIGGLIGGAAATGAVAGSKGYQVVLKEGTALTFTVSEQVALR